MNTTTPSTPRNPWILPLGIVEIVASDGSVTLGGLVPVESAMPTEAGEVVAATVAYFAAQSDVIDCAGDIQEGGSGRGMSAAVDRATAATKRLEAFGLCIY